jgi:alpha-tubulin suppressor-like RCC1 family protein
VACAGRDSEGQSSAPADIFTTIAAGWAHTCGLLVDGQPQCWGRIADPPSESTFSSIASGQDFSCGLDEAGTIECWGEAAVELTGVTSEAAFVDIAAGAKHLCARTEAGLTQCWGDNEAGQLDAPEMQIHSLVSGSGSLHSCGIAGVEDDLGEVHCWGLSAENQLAP